MKFSKITLIEIYCLVLTPAYLLVYLSLILGFTDQLTLPEIFRSQVFTVLYTSAGVISFLYLLIPLNVVQKILLKNKKPENSISSRLKIQAVIHLMMFLISFLLWLRVDDSVTIKPRGSILLSPGEAVRIAPDKESETPETDSITESMKFTAKTDINKLIEAEVSLLEKYTLLEEKLASTNIPLKPSQNLYYHNNTVILDALLKRFTSIRQNIENDFENWQSTFHFYKEFMKLRMQYEPVNPDMGPLVTFKELQIDTSGSKTGKETYTFNAVISVTGDAPVVISNSKVFNAGRYYFKMKDLYQSAVVTTEDSNSRQLYLNGQEFKVQNQKFMLQSLLPGEGSLNSSGGYIKHLPDKSSKKTDTLVAPEQFYDYIITEKTQFLPLLLLETGSIKVRLIIYFILLFMVLIPMVSVFLRKK